MPGVNIQGIKGYVLLPHDKTLKERQRDAHYKYVHTSYDDLYYVKPKHVMSKLKKANNVLLNIKINHIIVMYVIKT